MGYRIVNVCYVVLISAQVFSYSFRIQIRIQQTRVQQQYFMLTVIVHVVLWIADVHTTNKQHVHCVPQCRSLTQDSQPIHTKKTCVTRNISDIISTKVLHSRDTKTDISFSTCVYLRNLPLWKRPQWGI